MRKWGVVISAFYALILLVLLLPVFVLLAQSQYHDLAVRGDKFGEGSFANPFIFFGGLWVVWGVLFYLYFRNSSEIINHTVSWLLKGSILEMLIAIPCHVIVRRRDDCSAPAVTSFGIVTGIAIMLISFGPSVLFLYKKRLETYAPRSST